MVLVFLVWNPYALLEDGSLNKLVEPKYRQFLALAWSRRSRGCIQQHAVDGFLFYFYVCQTDGMA